MYVWKTVKVFISSTFKDLELERDELNNVFRALQEKFYQRKIAIIPYDLRWRQRHDEADIVQWCLEKIGECQYFVGILGHRYGWRPPKNGSGNNNKERYSITEMEIRHALDVIEKEKRFFFLDQKQWSPEQANETQEDLNSLKTFKDVLKKDETYFEYTESKNILEDVYKELEMRLERDYPNVEDFQTITIENARSDIIEEKIKGFIGRHTYLEKIEAFVSRNDAKNYLCIRAVAGTGKSALLAYYIQKVVEGSQIPIIWHYMSMAGANSAEEDQILANIGSQLKQLDIIKEDFDDIEDMRETIIQSLEHYDKKIVIAIDGLDEAQGKAIKLHWLPRNLPSHVRIILTTRPVEPWPILSQMQNLENFELPPLEESEIEELIHNYEQTNDLVLPQTEKTILKNRAAGSPLFLKVAFDEILSAGMAIGQLAESVDKLFEQILERLEKKYGKQFVEKYLGVIAASRSGLSENEIHEILKEEALNLHDDFVLILQKSFSHFIIRRNYLFNFFHPEFERTVKMRLGKNKLRNFHKLLVTYFQAKDFTYERAQYELAYQMQWGEEYKSLAMLLSNIHFLEAKAHMMEDLMLDFRRLLFNKVVPFPPHIKVKNIFNLETNKAFLEDLYRIFILKLPFLRRYPDSLFQTVWHFGYWTDSESLIRKFAEEWRKQKENHCWIRTLKAPQNTLHSPLEKNLRLHFGRIHDVIFSPDGLNVASAGGLYDMTIRIWDVATGECFQALKGHTAAVIKIRYTHDGKYIFSISRDMTLKIWDVKTGECSKTLEPGQDKLESLAVGDRYFATAGRTNTIQLWSLENFECLRIIEAHKDWVKSLIFHPQKNILASCSKDKTICLWDLNTGAKITSFEHDAEVWSLAFHPDGKKLVSSSRDKSIRIWDLEKNICERVLLGHTVGGVNCVAVSHCGNYIASGGEDKFIRIWNFVSEKAIHVFHGHQDRLMGIAFSPKEQKLVSSSKDKSVCFWRLGGKRNNDLRCEHENKISVIIREKEHIFSASSDQKVKVWKCNGTLLKTLEGSSGTINTLAYDNTNKRLIAAGNDRKLLLWKGESFTPTILPTKHKSGITHVTLDKSKRYLLSSSRDKTIQLWDLEEEKCLQVYIGHEDWVQKTLFHPQKNEIVSCSKDGTIRIWNKNDGTCLSILEGHKKWIRDIDYSQNGDYIISGSEDTTVRIWASETRDCYKVLRGHRRNVSSVRFYPDNKRAITWAWDGTIRIWDIETGKEQKMMRGKADLDHIIDDGIPYIALSSNLRTIIIDRITNKIMAVLPETIDIISIDKDGIITGGSGSGYLHLLKFCKEGVIKETSADTAWM